ncbi:MAG TPA: hypothetical protein DIS90_13905 [Cytophagales bacterium]|nr:hypothetical protein [Cytophagales bacterium]
MVLNLTPPKRCHVKFGHALLCYKAYQIAINKFMVKWLMRELIDFQVEQVIPGHKLILILSGLALWVMGCKKNNLKLSLNKENAPIISNNNMGHFYKRPLD